MSDLDYILAKRDQLKMSLDDWDRFISFPKPCSASVMAIEYFKSTETPFEVIEAVTSEAVSNNHTSEEYVLSMLVRSASQSSLEVDFGQGKFLRGNRPGTFVFGDLRRPQELKGTGPYNSIQLSIGTNAFRERIGAEAATRPGLERLQSGAFEDEILKVLVGQLMAYCRVGYHRTQTSGPSRMDKILDQICTRLLSLGGEKPPVIANRDQITSESVQRVLEYIHAFYDQKLERDQLAKIAKVTPCHFSRLFLKATGVSPKQYILRLRIAKARDILKNSPDLTVADIARALGFVDAPHFSREFQRQTGVSPAVYRRHS